MRNQIVRFALALLLMVSVALLAQAEAPQKLIVIDTLRMSLTLYENQREVRRFPIAAGTNDTPSPIGTFRIVGRFTPSEPGGFGTRFLALNVPWGNFGIHGTNKPGSIGSRASHGCFRMYSRDAEVLYRLVPNGTPVIVENGAYGELGTQLSTLHPGDRNATVRAVQAKLRAFGYYGGMSDGIFGSGTVTALRAFLKDRGLPWENRVDQRVYDALGLILFE